jgi:hypothetical protein
MRDVDVGHLQRPVHGQECKRTPLPTGPELPGTCRHTDYVASASTEPNGRRAHHAAMITTRQRHASMRRRVTSASDPRTPVLAIRRGQYHGDRPGDMPRRMAADIASLAGFTTPPLLHAHGPTTALPACVPGIHGDFDRPRRNSPHQRSAKRRRHWPYRRKRTSARPACRRSRPWTCWGPSSSAEHNQARHRPRCCRKAQCPEGGVRNKRSHGSPQEPSCVSLLLTHPRNIEIHAYAAPVAPPMLTARATRIARRSWWAPSAGKRGRSSLSGCKQPRRDD